MENIIDIESVSSMDLFVEDVQLLLQAEAVHRPSVSLHNLS